MPPSPLLQPAPATPSHALHSATPIATLISTLASEPSPATYSLPRLAMHYNGRNLVRPGSRPLPPNPVLQPSLPLRALPTPLGNVCPPRRATCAHPAGPGWRTSLAARSAITRRFHPAALAVSLPFPPVRARCFATPPGHSCPPRRATRAHPAGPLRRTNKKATTPRFPEAKLLPVASNA